MTVLQQYFVLFLLKQDIGYTGNDFYNFCNQLTVIVISYVMRLHHSSASVDVVSCCQLLQSE